MIDLSELNPAQKTAAETFNGPLLILAGAGSGKTKTMVYRIANMIDHGISPHNILAITFTNKAAGEMKERALALLDGKSEAPKMCTIHSLAVSILRTGASLLGYTNRFTICDADDSVKIMKRLIKEYAASHPNTSYDFNQLKPKMVLDPISHYKDSLIGPEQAIQYINNKSDGATPSIDEIIVCDLYKTYQKTLMTGNIMDFDDLVFNAVMAFRKAPKMLESFSDHYQYIIVDEYQDTSHGQYEMIKMLAGKYRNLAVVGDDYQSIYKFRGADISNILSFEKEYPDAKTITLGINYRSTGTIVDSAAAVIRNNVNQKHKELSSARNTGNHIHVTYMDDNYQEAKEVIDQITDMINKGYKYSDFAILYRKNVIAGPFEQEILRAKMPYKIYGGINFFQRAEIKDIISYMKCMILNDDVDDLAVTRIINVPARSIGNKTIDDIRLYAAENNISMFKALTTAPAALKNKHVQEFVKLIASLNEQFKDIEQFKDMKTGDDIISRILTATGYEEYLKKKDEDSAKKRVEKINLLADMIDNYKEDNGITWAQSFFEDAVLLTDQDTDNENNDRISLMSMHRSKGLEFKVVFIVGLEEEIMCDCNSGTLELIPDENIEEDRRLMYVAMTRAKDELYISTCNNRFMYGKWKADSPCHFIEEIPENHITEQDLCSSEDYEKVSW